MLTIQRSRLRPYHWIIGLIVLLTLSLGVVGFGRIAPTLARVPDSYDFAAYYVAGRVLNTGEALYTDQAMIHAAQTPHGTVAFPRYIYPPFFAVLMRPLSTLSFATAKTVWFVLNLLLLIGCGIVLGRWIDWSWKAIGGLLVAIILIPAFYDTLLLGQVNLVLLTLVLAHLMQLRQASTRHQEIRSGIWLGIASAIKIYPIFFMLPYLLRRRWNVISGVVLGGVLGTGVGLIFGGGFTALNRFLTDVVGGFSGTNIADQSLSDVISRLFSTNTFTYAYLTPTNLVSITLKPLIDAPLIATLLTGVIGFVLSAVSMITLWKSRHHPFDDRRLWLELSIMIILTLIVLPVVHDHYLSLLIIPFCTLIQIWHQQGWSQPSWWKIGLSSVVLWLVVQRYWRVLLNILPSPVFLSAGLLASLILWLLTIQTFRTVNAKQDYIETS